MYEICGSSPSQGVIDADRLTISPLAAGRSLTHYRLISVPTAAHVAPLLLLLGASAAAAEPTPPPRADDLRFVYSRGPDRYAISSPAPGLDHDGRWDRAQGLRLDLLRSLQPLGWGVSLAGQQNQEDHLGDRLGYQALSGRLNLGLALSPVDQMQFEILPFAGYGLSEFDQSGALGQRSDRDDFFEYGLNVNASLTTASGLQFGGGIGYLVNESTYDLGGGGAAASVDLEQRGPVYSIFIGTRR